MSQLNWTEAQWNRVNSAITEEFTKASVAGRVCRAMGQLVQAWKRCRNNTSTLTPVSQALLEFLTMKLPPSGQFEHTSN